MDAFNLLKFWRNSIPDDTAVSGRDIVSDDVRNPSIETDEDIDDDAGSFFDLVFTGPDGRPKLDNSSVNSPRDPESPIDVFFKPKAFPIDSNSKPQSPISILRSAPKFRVFFLGFRKTKPEKVVVDDSSKIRTQKMLVQAESKRFTVKCKVEEVPVSVSPVFTRDNSLRSKLQKEKEEDFSVVRADVPKYLKLMKPLYARASKRYTDKISVSPLFSPSTQSMCSTRKASEEKRIAASGSVRKHLGKSRSAVSSFAGVSTSPLNRRDDSLLQAQNDGIQGAILHCKKSYNSLAKVTCTEDLNRWSI